MSRVTTHITRCYLNHALLLTSRVTTHITRYYSHHALLLTSRITEFKLHDVLYNDAVSSSTLSFLLPACIPSEYEALQLASALATTKQENDGTSFVKQLVPTLATTIPSNVANPTLGTRPLSVGI